MCFRWIFGLTIFEQTQDIGWVAIPLHREVPMQLTTVDEAGACNEDHELVVLVSIRASVFEDL